VQVKSLTNNYQFLNLNVLAEPVPAKKSRKAPSKTTTNASAPAPKANKVENDYSTITLGSLKESNFKIATWNVAGLRAWVNKGGLDYIHNEKPDIICLQEIKCIEDLIPEEAKAIKGYHPYWLCKPGGQAGVAIYSKLMPYSIKMGLDDDELDDQGRLLTAEYEKYFLVCVYVPNAGRKLVTLPKRLRWDEKFQHYLKELNAKKPVIVCGDMNVSHLEIDLANPKANRRNAGFTQEERDGMTKMLSMGFVDTFRHFYPDQEKAYTYWTYMMNCRAKDVGW
jgi:AP endonuclease 1